MTKTRWIAALAASVVFLAAACWLVTGAFPLSAAPQLVSDAPGVTVDIGGAQVVNRPGILYPEDAITKGVQGTVVVQVEVDADGTVKGVTGGFWSSSISSPAVHSPSTPPVRGPIGAVVVESEVSTSRGALVTGASRTGSVEVRSPVTDLRQLLMFGAVTPNRDSRKRSWEVWSNTSEQTYPPAEKGETTNRGTRTPRPIGPSIPLAEAGRGSTVRYSPVVPAGEVGGET